MGGFLTALLQSVGRTGNEAAEGQDIAKRSRFEEEDRKLKLLQSQLGLNEVQQRMGATQQRMTEGRAPKVIATYRAPDGKMHNMMQDPMTGSISDQVAPGPGEQSALGQKQADLEAQLGRKLTPQEVEQMGGLKEKEDLETKWSEAQRIAKTAFPNDKTKQLEFARSLMPGGASVNKLVFPGLGKTTNTPPEPMLKALADKWANEGVKPPAKVQDDVELYMAQHNMKTKAKLTGQEQGVGDAIKTAQPMVDRLVKYLEDNKLTDQNAWVFGDHSSLMQHMRFYGYQKGKAPEAISSELIKDAAAIQVMGAKPWMTMGRGKYLYETIVQHLPQPTDTPKLLYDKVTWLRDNVLQDALQALPEGWDSQNKGRQSQNDSTVPPNPYDK